MSNSNDIQKFREVIQANLESLSSDFKGSFRYSIIAKWSDGRELKICSLERDISKLDQLFDRAIDQKPDSMLIKCFEGEGSSVEEIPNTRNELKFRNPPKKTKKKPLAGPPAETPPPALPGNLPPRIHNETDMRLEFMSQSHELEKDRINHNHQIEIDRLNGKIEKLTETNTSLQEDLDDLKSEYEDLRTQAESIREKGVRDVKTFLTGGLGALAAFAAKNPEGKMLGFIPNRAITGLLGTGEETAENTQQPENPRRSYYDMITNYCNALPDEKFNQVFQIFDFLATDPANIDLVWSLINNKSSH